MYSLLTASRIRPLFQAIIEEVLRLILSLIFLQSFLWIQTSKAEFCPELYYQKPNLQSIANIKDEVEESPYIVACKEPPGLLKGRPKTGLSRRSVFEKDGQGHSTRAFLKQVQQKALARVQAAQNQIQNTRKCMYDFSPQCAELKNWVDVELPKFVKKARFHLSLSQSTSEAKTWVGQANEKPNSDLSPLGSYKLQDWAPLTPDEDKKAKDTLKKYKKEIGAEMSREIKSHEICFKCGQRFYEDSMVGIRFQHFQTYHQMMSELPVVQYLTGPNVTATDLIVAFKFMEKDLQSEEAKLKAWGQQLDSQAELSPDVLQLMNYNSEVEGSLLENPSLCGLSSSLTYTLSNRQLGNSLAIGLPIMVVSMLVPPLAGFGIGFVGGAAMAGMSYYDFSQLQSKNLGFIYGDALGTDLSYVERADKQWKYDVVTLPVGMGLGSIALRSAKIGVKALVNSRKIFTAGTAASSTAATQAEP